MSQTIKLPNYPSNNLAEYTRLDADSLAAANSITVQNSQDFSAGQYVLIGNPGSETAEIAIVGTVSSNTSIPFTTNLKFPHDRFSFVYKLNGNKLRVYRANNIDGTQPADGVFALIDTVDVDTDQSYTLYIDATGSSAHWWKYTFYNSTTTTETNIADSKAVRGGNNNYISIDAIRNEAGFNNNRNIGDELIDDKRQIAQSEINGAISGIYVLPFTEPINEVIKNIALLLATGYLLMSQYTYTNSRYKDGESMVKMAQAQLERIKSGQLVLTGVTAIELPKDTTVSNGFSGWPDSTTAGLSSDENGAGDFMFKRSSIDGYSERKY